MHDSFIFNMYLLWKSESSLYTRSVCLWQNYCKLKFLTPKENECEDCWLNRCNFKYHPFFCGSVKAATSRSKQFATKTFQRHTISRSKDTNVAHTQSSRCSDFRTISSSVVPFGVLSNYMGSTVLLLLSCESTLFFKDVWGGCFLSNVPRSRRRRANRENENDKPAKECVFKRSFLFCSSVRNVSKPADRIVARSLKLRPSTINETIKTMNAQLVERAFQRTAPRQQWWKQSVSRHFVVCVYTV